MNQIINGLREGYWEYYYNDGKLWQKGNFSNGLREGYWEYHSNNGELDLQEIYI